MSNNNCCYAFNPSYDANEPSSYAGTTVPPTRERSNSDLILPDDYEFKADEFDSHW